MQLKSGRFGTIDAEDGKTISFRKGILGFPEQQDFILLRPVPSSPIGWLQSIQTPALSFPVVSVDALAVDYSYIEAALAKAGEKVEAVSSTALMVVLTAPGGGVAATVNLLAPIVVNADTLTGCQVVIDAGQYSTKEPFAMRLSAGAAGKGAAAAGTEKAAHTP